MLNKLKKNVIRYPITIGFAGIIFIVLFICWHWQQSVKERITVNVVTEEMERESNVGGYTLPAEPIAYFIKAAGLQDMDRALRVFPIEQLAKNISLKRIAEEDKTFGIEIPTSSQVSNLYYELSNAELTEKYAELYMNLLNRGLDLAKVDLRRVVYKPYGTEEKEAAIILSDITGAEEFRKLDAYVEIQKELYRIPFIVVRYGNSIWRVFDVETEQIEKVQEKDLESIRDLAASSLKVLRDKERIGKKAKKVINSGEAILPLNYVWTNAVYAESPKDLMKKFEKYVQKNELKTLLTFGNVMDEQRCTENVDVKQLIGQGEFAKKIKSFYYTMLLGMNVESPKTLSGLDVSVNEIESKLKPEFFFYSSMVGMLKIADDEYQIYWKYEGEYFRFTFIFAEYAAGWQIKDITGGEKISEEKYRQEVGA